MLFAFGDFFGTMRIEQSAHGDRMLHQYIFIDANVETKWFLHFDILSRAIYLYEVVWDSKKWILMSESVGFERHEKIFCTSLGHTVCFRRLLWDHAHLTKCAGWSHDAPINFYWRKRESWSILVFWWSLKTAFEEGKCGEKWWKMRFWWCFWTSVGAKKFSKRRITIQ